MLELILVLSALTVDLSESSILLELDRFRIRRVVNVLDRLSWLFVVNIQHSTRTGDSLVMAARKGLLSLRRRFLRLFIITTTIASLCPSVYHLDFFQPTAHHSIIRVLIWENPLYWTTSLVSLPGQLGWLLLFSR